MSLLRSLLFIPGDNEKKLAKGDDCGADALVLDLEDSVAAARKPLARELVRSYLDERSAARRAKLWVRINPLDSPHAMADLVAVVGGMPDGIMLPKANGPSDIVQLGHYLDALEAREGIETGHVKILPVATETAAAPFALGDYAKIKLPRLLGLTWGAEDLSSAIGASRNKDGDGQWAFTYRLVRSQCLLAAHAAGVQAIDTLFADYHDMEGLKASCREGMSEGFTGRIAIHPAQAQVINESFSPSQEEVEHARRVLKAFAAQPDAGTVGLDGKMLDIPHLKQAQRVLAAHDRSR